MKETKPDVIKKDSAPQIKARTFSEKFFRGILEFGGKELVSTIAALLVSYGSLEIINDYINKSHGVPAIEKDIAKINEQIKVIRDRQKNMGGPIPEWWDRVIVKGDIMSSVNILETKLKALNTKRSAVITSTEAIKPYWDFMTFMIIFSLTIGYIRTLVGSIIDKTNTGWRENKIVSDTNKALLEIHTRLENLENQLAELTQKTTENSDLAQLKQELTNMLGVLKKEVEKLPEEKKE